MQARERPELHGGPCSLCPPRSGVRGWEQRRHPARGSSIPALGGLPSAGWASLPQGGVQPVCPPVSQDGGRINEAIGGAPLSMGRTQPTLNEGL